LNIILKTTYLAIDLIFSSTILHGNHENLRFRQKVATIPTHETHLAKYFRQFLDKHNPSTQRSPISPTLHAPMGKRESEASESPRNGGARKSRTETVTPTVRTEWGKEFYLLHAGGREVDVHGEDPDILAVHLLHSAQPKPPRSASSLAAGRRPYAPLTVSHGARQGVGSVVAGSYACVGDSGRLAYRREEEDGWVDDADLYVRGNF
jgi:hypothetical protein